MMRVPPYENKCPVDGEASHHCLCLRCTEEDKTRTFTQQRYENP